MNQNDRKSLSLSIGLYSCWMDESLSPCKGLTQFQPLGLFVRTTSVLSTKDSTKFALGKAYFVSLGKVDVNHLRTCPIPIL